MAETLQIILRDIERQGIQNQIGAGVVLTGGGAHMKGLIKLAERIFRVPCMVGRPMGFSGLATVTERPEYASAAGLIRYAFKDAKSVRGARSFFMRVQDFLSGR
jgi:cell division protein FtsA